MASGGMSVLGSPAALGRDSPRVATTTSAHARVCFELNAAVVVVAVLVLRHTSSNFTGQCLAALSLLRALIRNRRDQASLLYCCDNTSPIATQLTHACDPIVLFLSECCH